MEVLRWAAWTLTTLLCVSSYRVTVRSGDLQPCEDDERVCVAHPRDCGPRPPSALQEALNMSCYYQASPGSMTCEWGEESDADADASLVFGSARKVIACQSLFNPAARLEIAARLRRSGAETWSQPQPVLLFSATKPAPPDLRVAGSTADSVVVSWARSGGEASCRLRYRAIDGRAWSEVPVVASAPRDQRQVHTIGGLLPSTVYTAAASCRRTSGPWSDWSAGVRAATLRTAPSRSPRVCYSLENMDSGGRLLRLTLQALDSHDAEGGILGYRVSYGPATGRRLRDGGVLNVTEEATSVQLGAGNWSVSVAAFNAAGHGPAAKLSVDTQAPSSPPPVSNLWVSGSVPPAKALTVQWSTPADPRLHVVCRWRPEAGGRWTTVHGASSPAVIRDVDPDQSYHISVFTVSQQRCGSPRSLSASLQLGALMEPSDLKVIGANGTAATATWAWQRKPRPIRVDGYRLELRSHSETQTQALWLDQSRHTFLNLTPHTAYSLVLLADNASAAVIPVRSDDGEVPPVAMATRLLLLLLAAGVLIVSVLSRPLLKGLLLPRVSSPRGSTLGRWLMDPGRTGPAEPSVLDITRFQETDVLGASGAIVVGPRRSNAAPPPPEPPVLTLSDLRLDAGRDSGGPAERRPQRRLPDEASEGGGVDSPPRPTPDGNRTAAREGDGQLDRLTPQRARDDLNRRVLQLVARAEGRCSDRPTCEEEYVGAVTCDTNYLPNMAAVTP